MSVEVEVLNTSVETTKKVTVRVQGSEQVSRFLNKPIIPDTLVVHYKDTGNGWQLVGVDVHGGFVKNDGTAGKTRTYTGWGSRDLDGAPEYIQRLAKQHHPDRSDTGGLESGGECLECGSPSYDSEFCIDHES